MHHEGFSLLECLIALFILAILANTVLRHQLYLLRTQQYINDCRSAEMLKHSGEVLSNFPHPDSWKQVFEAKLQSLEFCQE